MQACLRKYGTGYPHNTLCGPSIVSGRILTASGLSIFLSFLDFMVCAVGICFFLALAEGVYPFRNELWNKILYELLWEMKDNNAEIKILTVQETDVASVFFWLHPAQHYILRCDCGIAFLFQITNE